MQNIRLKVLLFDLDSFSGAKTDFRQKLFDLWYFRGAIFFFIHKEGYLRTGRRLLGRRLLDQAKLNEYNPVLSDPADTAKQLVPQDA